MDFVCVTSAQSSPIFPLPIVDFDGRRQEKFEASMVDIEYLDAFRQ